MKKITLLLFTLVLGWQSFAQTDSDVQTYAWTGSDSAPMVYTIADTDVTVNQGETITAATLSGFFMNYGATGTTDYCGDYFDMTLDVVGGVADATSITGCAADFEALDVTGFTSLTFTSVDSDAWTDAFNSAITLNVTWLLPTAVATQDACWTGSDSAPMVYTFADTDITVNQGQTVTATTLSGFFMNYGATGTTDYCGDYFDMTLDVVGGVADATSITGCAADFEALDVTGFTSLTFTSVDSDAWTDTFNSCITLNVTYLEPQCFMPLDLTVANLTTTSADLSWTSDGSETMWDIELVDVTAAGTATGTATATGVTNPYSQSGLSANNTYEYYVRANCDGSESVWAGPFSFTTLCEAIAIPFAEGFNSDSSTQNCWTVLNENADADAWDMDYTTNPFEGDESAIIYTDYNSGANDDWLISPGLILTGNERLKFQSRVESAGEPNNFEVLLSTTGIAPADFTNVLLADADYSNITYVEYVVNLSAYSGTSYIAFHVPAGGLDGWRLYIDDVLVETLPSCVEPTALSVSNTTFTSADLAWTAGDTETAWNVEVVTTGTTPTGTATDTGVTNPFTATGLTANTSYEYYVQADCGGATSVWVGPFAFYTGYCVPEATDFGTYTDAFESTGALVNTSTTGTGNTTGYSDYYDTNTVETFPGGAFDFSATIVGGTAGYAVWVDWNNDLTFDAATETVYNTTTYGSGPFTGSIEIPVATALGDYRLRTMVDYNDSNPDDDACAFAYGRGEAEDYKITVSAAPTDEMDWNNVQWVTDGTNGSNTSVTVEANTAVTVYAQGYEAGVTDAAGAGVGVECWIAINADNTDPSTWGASVWQVATYGGDSGNNDEYTYTTATTAPGTHYVASRWRLNNAGFTYAGYNGPWDGTTNVNVELIVNPIANDDCSGAIALTAGGVFIDNPVVGSNLGATASEVADATIPAPGCASYQGGDVWYAVTVPPSGDLIIDTNANPTGNGGDSGMAVYTGTCGALVLYDCDDDGSSDGAYSMVSIDPADGLAGQTVYVRVWEYGNDADLNFQISAYSPSLSVDDFESVGFKYFPNPVNDQLSLRAQQTINSVSIYNMLGQEVLRTSPNAMNDEVNMSSLQSGAYFVRVTIGDNSKTIKIIKE